MSPRQFDPGIVEARLTSIAQLLEDLQRYELDDAAKLRADRGMRHIAERILIALVELATSINSHFVASKHGRAPTGYRHSFELAAEYGLISSELADELMPSVGTRNVLVHEYLEIDLDLVAASVKRALEGYGRYLGAVAEFVR